MVAVSISTTTAAKVNVPSAIIVAKSMVTSTTIIVF
jgi:hypothetical protein